MPARLLHEAEMLHEDDEDVADVRHGEEGGDRAGLYQSRAHLLEFGLGAGHRPLEMRARLVTDDGLNPRRQGDGDLFRRRLDGPEDARGIDTELADDVEQRGSNELELLRKRERLRELDRPDRPDELGISLSADDRA